MSGPKKPQRAMALQGLSAPPLDLTAPEMSLLMAYRKTDDEGRKTIDHMATFQAERWPRRPAGLLRLVRGGAQ